MNKIYFAGPVLAMLLFAGIFSATHGDTAKREAAKELALRREKEIKLKTEAELRQKAIAEAVQAQELRKKERAEKEARELAEQEARQQLVELRDRTFREQDKLAKQIERLKKDLEAEAVATTKITEETKVLAAERTFLAEFVRQAGSNTKALEALLAKIAADSARPAVDTTPKKTS